ncbi:MULTISPECIES: carbohydrate ABC transporter permease [Nocardioides]|uniref:Carbohydrate ABC transporter permease n=1 Tax=Nocardioides vastitatis TaxID=2568655 RepID=A0ABW0ZEB1_9ACTN|nr:sugar ABC transporter permease [Nocardioides sp.]THI99562.1 sugar ABC transporter permease [Nocardioides sp.]
MIKVIAALVTVVVGIGAAIVLYWVLNKLAEVLPGKWEHRLKPYLYILPAYAALAFYLVYPAIQTVVYSFKDSASQGWVGIENYTDLLSSEGFQQTLINTFLWMLVVPFVTVVLGLAVAVLADRLTPKFEKASKTIIFLPMAISFVGAGTVWGLVYDYRPPGRDQIGLQNAIVTALGFDPIAWLDKSDFHLNSFLLMVMLLWAQIGFAMVLLSAAIKGVPVDTIEAARIDGATERQIFFSVVVPQIWGSIVTVFIITLISVMKVFDVVYVMTNGRANTNVIGNEFFNQLFTNFNTGAAASIVVLLMLATIPIMWYQVRHFRREESLA